MAKKIVLSIAEPCHENWENMSPSEIGRFCGSCKKQVIDFSNLNDRQIAQFFKKPSTGSVCGRFMADQLDREIDIPKKRIPWFRYFFQIVLPAFLISIKGSAQNRGTKNESLLLNGQHTIRADKDLTIDTLVLPKFVISTPVPVSTPGDQQQMLIRALSGRVGGPVITVIKKDTPVSPRPGLDFSHFNVMKKDNDSTITGTVMDEKGYPLAGASVRIKGTRIGTLVNSSGMFCIKAKPGDVLIAGGVGLSSTEYLLQYEKKVDIYVELAMLGAVSVKRKPERITNHEEKRKKIQVRDTALNKLRIFPNPLKSGGELNVECLSDLRQVCDYKLFSIQGNLLSTIHVEFEKGLNRTKIETLAGWSAGIYLLKLYAKGKLIASEKIVIQ